MDRLQGLLGVAAILALVIAISRHRSQIRWRILVGGLILQVALAFLVLKWSPGEHALEAAARWISNAIGYANEGTKFLFGGLVSDKIGSVFALNVLPVVVFLGAVIGGLYYLRVIQWFIEILGTALSKVLGTTKLESVWASTVIVLGQSEAPLLIAPYLPRLTRSQLYTCMTGGFASVAGSTLVGYSLLGAPLPYLLAASVMNAPASLVVAKAIWPETEPAETDAEVRRVKDTESANLIDAVSRGALAGGRLAVTVGCLLLAFVALIALLNAAFGEVGSWVGLHGLTLQKLFGWIFAPIAWLIGVPWHDAATVGDYLGQKTVVNEFVAYASFGPHVHDLGEKTVLVTTFALAGFANFSSIAIQIGTFGGLVPERRGEVAKLGLLALLGGTLTNLLNASIVGVVVG